MNLLRAQDGTDIYDRKNSNFSTQFGKTINYAALRAPYEVKKHS